MEIKKTPVQIPLTCFIVWLLFCRHLWLCRRFSGTDGKGGAVFLRHILIAADSGRRKLDSDPENESTLAVSAWRNCGLRGDVSGSEIFLFPVQCAGGSGN